MILLKTKAGTFVEVPAGTKMKQNDFGVWFWENFFNIDGKVVEIPNFETYTEIYTDYVNQPTINKETR